MDILKYRWQQYTQHPSYVYASVRRFIELSVGMQVSVLIGEVLGRYGNDAIASAGIRRHHG